MSATVAAVTSFDLDTYTRDRLRLIHDGLDRWTPPETVQPEALHEAMRYSLFAGGKRLRPLLCIAAAEAVGGRATDVLPFACALEMIQTFSLIHDDLPAIDNDDLRRGRPTSHVKYGEAMAILTGDALHTLAFGTVAAYQTAAEPARVLRAIHLLADASGTAGMVGGQVDDIHYEGKEVTPEILRRIHARKTGALLSVSLLGGGILCGASLSQEAALRGYGDQIGIAFQIVDDILDVIGDDARIGKTTGSDERKDKATYPKIFGLERSQQMAREASNKAIASLTDFGPAAAPLRGIARYIVERDM